MNIIIFDSENNCHQFDAPKKWVGNFMENAAFFSKDKKEVLEYMKTQLSNSSSILEDYKKSKLDDAKNLAKMIFGPSVDYGITIIDFKNKKVLTLNEYSSLKSIPEIETNLNFNSWGNFTDSEKNKLLNYRELLEKEIYLKEGGNKKTIQNIDNYLNFKEESPVVKILKQFYKKVIFKEEGRTEFKINKVTGWRVISGSEGYDISIQKKMIGLIISHGIILSSKQQKYWQNFYTDSISDCDFEFLERAASFIEEECLSQAIKLEKKKLGTSLNNFIKIENNGKAVTNKAKKKPLHKI